MDIARIRIPSGFVATGEEGITQYRFGIWSACYYDTQETRSCLKTGHGYEVALQNGAKNAGVIIGSSWTTGLAIHPVATAAIFVAFVLSFSSKAGVMLAATITAFLAALLTLLAFAVDIALYAWVKHQVGLLPDVSEEVVTSPAFWMTFVSLLLVLGAGCTMFIGRKKERMAGATTYPAYSSSSKTPFWQRSKK